MSIFGPSFTFFYYMVYIPSSLPSLRQRRSWKAPSGKLIKILRKMRILSFGFYSTQQSFIPKINILLTFSFSTLLISFFKRNPANWYLYTVFFIHLSNWFFSDCFSFFWNWLFHTGFIKLAFSNWLFSNWLFHTSFFRLAFSNWLFQTDFF